MFDPFHPLYGKRFKVHSLTGGAVETARVYVEYRDGIRLSILRRSTNLSHLEPTGPRSKLTAAAVKEFLALVKECEPCLSRPRKSGHILQEVRSRRRTRALASRIDGN